MSDTPPAPDTPPAATADPSPPAAERAISPIAGRLAGGRAGKAAILAALGIGCGVFLLATWGDGQPQPEGRPVQPARQVVPFEPLRAPPTLAAPGPDAPTLGPGPQVPAPQPGAAGPAGPDSRAQRQAELSAIRGAPLLAYRRGGEGPAVAGPAQAPTAPVAGAGTELEVLRRGSAIGRVRASRVGDRNFLILAGAHLPCVLQTAMDSTTPGYVSCLAPRDVYSDNGAVVLMEKGSKVLGEYRAGLRGGQKRLFVLWTRAVTPAGVAIDLASPAADPLGRAGFDGDLDTHFWDRFGGALLLSVVDDAVYATAGRNEAATTTRLPSEAAAIAMQNSVNIPPTLRKAQGAEVSIFVAQDLDFSSVYGLRAR